MQDARNAPLLGIGFMLAGMFFISVNDVLIKGLSGGYPLHQIVAFRSGVGMIFVLGILMAEGGFRLLIVQRPGLHVLRAVLVVFANSAFYLAFVAMPLATATALYFVAPLFVTLMSIPFLGEKVGVRRMTAILVGFAGVLVLLGPELSLGAGWAAVLPVLSAAGYAGTSVLTRKLGQATRASTLALHLQVAFIIVAAAMYLLAGDGRYADSFTSESLRFAFAPWVWPEPEDLPSLIGLGFLSACIGYAMAQAYRQAPASVVAPFEYVLMIFALLWGWLFFAEWPRATVFLGATIIIASGIYIVVRERRRPV
ncbi:MAG: DMT family transporter [Proteobacteria bacterium]|nr:DMT family transporter [Pseudomonadota bacterium]